jgi:hypothetical protein
MNPRNPTPQNPGQAKESTEVWADPFVAMASLPSIVIQGKNSVQ